MSGSAHSRRIPRFDDPRCLSFGLSWTNWNVACERLPRRSSKRPLPAFRPTRSEPFSTTKDSMRPTTSLRGRAGTTAPYCSNAIAIAPPIFRVRRRLGVRSTRHQHPADTATANQQEQRRNHAAQRGADLGQHRRPFETAGGRGSSRACGRHRSTCARFELRVVGRCGRRPAPFLHSEE
jgi:hypothetical protein